MVLGDTSRHKECTCKIWTQQTFLSYQWISLGFCLMIYLWGLWSIWNMPLNMVQGQVFEDCRQTPKLQQNYYVRNVQSMINLVNAKFLWKRCKLWAAQILNDQKNKGSQAQEYIGGNKNNQKNSTIQGNKSKDQWNEGTDHRIYRMVRKCIHITHFKVYRNAWTYSNISTLLHESLSTLVQKLWSGFKILCMPTPTLGVWQYLSGHVSWRA